MQLSLGVMEVRRLEAKEDRFLVVMEVQLLGAREDRFSVATEEPQLLKKEV